MVVVYSTTKGLAAMAMALAYSRGLLDYDEPVCKYWPEFAQNGKEKITIRQLLAHQAGLFAFDEPVDKETVRDLDRLAEVMARQKPAWEPGTRQAYHAITLGFYEGELIRRVDPEHRSLGRFFQDEIATPLGLDLYIRLPESIPNSRLAVIEPLGISRMIFGFPLKFTLATLNRHSNIYRALVVNPGSAIVHDEKTIYSRNLEVPSGGGVGTARSIAKAYGVFASGGRELGLSRKTLAALAAPPIPSANEFYDECMLAEARFSLGFGKPSLSMSFPNPSAFGHPGAGGSMAFADPENEIGYAYVTNRMGTELTGDPRELAIRNALYSILSGADRFDGVCVS
jgi:CubicO group peptidase (beta-lactamase class C family)